MPSRRRCGRTCVTENVLRFNILDQSNVPLFITTIAVWRQTDGAVVGAVRVVRGSRISRSPSSLCTESLRCARTAQLAA